MLELFDEVLLYYLITLVFILFAEKSVTEFWFDLFSDYKSILRAFFGYSLLFKAAPILIAVTGMPAVVLPYLGVFS